MADPSEFLQASALQRIAELDRLALGFYQVADVQQAARFFGEGYNIAESLMDKEQQIRLGRWWGACLFECGRLREAITALAPIVMIEPESHLEEFYVAVVKYIEAAQMIPVSLSALESAHDRLAQYTSDSRRGDWQHMGIRLRADLACLRGDYQEGVALAQLSWRTASAPAASGGPRFLSDEYLNTLARAQLLSGDLEGARWTLDEWQLERDEIESYRTAIYNARRSDVMRRAGDQRSAIDAGRIAVTTAEMSNHYLATCSALNALARALICAGSLDLAEDTIGQLLGRLRDESLIESFRAGVLRGDLELNRLRSLYGLRIVDDESDQCDAPGSTIGQAGANPALEDGTVQRCRDCYVSALETGRKVDDLLQCETWTGTARSRIARLERVVSIASAYGTRDLPLEGP